MFLGTFLGLIFIVTIVAWFVKDIVDYNNPEVRKLERLKELNRITDRINGVEEKEEQSNGYDPFGVWPK